MSVEPKKRTHNAAIAKLQGEIAERVKDDELALNRRQYDIRPRTDYRDGLTASGRRKYAESCKPGGPRHHLVQDALKCITKAQRVDYCAQLMASGIWRTPLGPVLAEAWGLEYGSVKGYTSEASRLVRGALGDPEEIRTKTMAFLEEVGADALENGDRRSAISAARTLAEIAGILTHKTEISGPDGGPIRYQDLSRLTDEELERAIISAAAGALKKRADADSLDDAAKAILAEDDARKRE